MFSSVLYRIREESPNFRLNQGRLYKGEPTSEATLRVAFFFGREQAKSFA